jgi:uncharacterized protein YndB with AHSA1/START domain
VNTTSSSRSGPHEALDASDFAFTRRAWVDAPPDQVYELVSDVSTISRWSPNALDAAYDPGDGPHAGAWFSGRNRKDGREWTTRSHVTQADPGAAFTYTVGDTEDGIVRWSWTLQPEGRGTVVQQSWQLLRLDPVLGTTRHDLETLRDYMSSSAETTLLALARWIAEEHPRQGS